MLLAILDGIGVPLPAGVDAMVITLAALDPASAHVTAALAIGASIAGSIVLFAIARKGGQRYLDKYTQRGRGAMFRRWFQRYGLVTVFISALMPIPMPMKVFVLCAGALGVGYLAFVLVMIAARVPRFIALAYLGAQVGEHSVTYLKQNAWNLIGIAVALFILLILLVRVSERWRKPAVSY